MKKVFQTIIDPGKGNCMQAVIASIFDKELHEVPNFIECEDWFKVMYEFIQNEGYDYHGMFHNKNFSKLLTPTYACFNVQKWHIPSTLSIANLKKYKGVNGYFFGSVLSPKYFNYRDGLDSHTHAVVIDINCNIVHDPNPEYKDILQYPLADLLKYNGIINVFDISKK